MVLFLSFWPPAIRYHRLKKTSNPIPASVGCPPGVSTGPILLTLYAQPLSNIIQKRQFDYHNYAGDTELQKAAPPSDFSQVSRETTAYVANVKVCMNKSKVKLNDEKTELLVIGDRICHSLVRKDPLTFGSCSVPFQTSAKYLGVHLDETLSMNKQISSLCRSSYFHLRKIGSIRPYLTDASTAKLVSSLILSSFVYCNSTLSGRPSSLKRLQKFLNNAARLVLRKRKSNHVTPLLKQLYWLPSEACIHYKIDTFAFRHFENSLAPYLSELLQIYQPTRTHRSSNEILQKVPKTNQKSAGNRSFRSAVRVHDPKA